MKMTISSTTDGKFLGHVIDTDANPVRLPDGSLFTVDRKTPLSDGTRLSNSNYIIDLKPISVDG